MDNIKPTRVKNTQFINKIMSAVDAAKLIPHNALVGFSGFVGSGCPLVVPVEIANRAKELHAKGEEYQIKALSGASTDINLDGVLAEADAVSFRAPFITDRTMRGNINTNKTQYMDIHLSTLAQQVEAGFFGKLDFAVIEIIGVTEDGKLIPSTSIGNNQVWLNVADKVILEVNHFQPEQL
ncbi:MAG: propionyl-CoA--succinate CoA transferase, partial [Neisseriaceae bacterium]|nr:propionyl-CoA--succinate CoA transferase [Neisseriaceae bacterium]